jgi:hypothetical protein
MPDTTPNASTEIQKVATDATKAASWVSAEELWFRTHQFYSGLIAGGLIVAVIALTIALLK